MSNAKTFFGVGFDWRRQMKILEKVAKEYAKGRVVTEREIVRMIDEEIESLWKEIKKIKKLLGGGYKWNLTKMN